MRVSLIVTHRQTALAMRINEENAFSRSDFNTAKGGFFQVFGLTVRAKWAIDTVLTVIDRALEHTVESKISVHVLCLVIIVPMNTPTNLTPHQLRQAADIQERILDLQDELSRLLEGGAVTHGAVSGRRRLSPQGLANIRAGARKRWAKFRSENGDSPSPRRQRRKMSAAARSAIAARMRARWAAAKRSGRNAL